MSVTMFDVETTQAVATVSELTGLDAELDQVCRVMFDTVIIVSSGDYTFHLDASDPTRVEAMFAECPRCGVCVSTAVDPHDLTRYLAFDAGRATVPVSGPVAKLLRRFIGCTH